MQVSSSLSEGPKLLDTHGQPPKKSQLRAITHSQRVHEMSEGLGWRVRRCIGNSTVRCLPPFISCEIFRTTDVGRAPHPARGGQKVSVVLTGKILIEYSPSDVVELGPGDVTSLMVGRGVIRSVRAGQEDSATPASARSSDPPALKKRNGNDVNPGYEATAFQLHMDVPESFKRIESSHINLCNTDIVTINPREGVTVNIVTGSAFGKKASQMLTATPVTILDCTVKPGCAFAIPVRAKWNAFAFLVRGEAAIQGLHKRQYEYVEFMRPSMKSNGHNGRTMPKEEKGERKDLSEEDRTGRSLSLKATQNDGGVSSDGGEDDDKGPPNGDESESGDEDGNQDTESERVIEVSVSSKASGSARLFFCAAEPLSQPIYRQGPFVDVSMNWIHQAFDDYSEQRNGFESRRAWQNSAQTHDPSMDESDAYNPCEEGSTNDSGCGADDSESDSEPGMNCKATFPNAFPPGKINSAEQSSEFNGNECVEAQQESKVPKRRRSPSPDTESASESGGDSHKAE